MAESMGGAEFLRSRRKRLSSEQLGIVSVGRSAAPGIRREEGAALAGLSPASYARMERGELAWATPQVLHRVARALRLSERDTRRLIAYAHDDANRARRGRNSTLAPRIEVGLRRLLGLADGVPLWVRDGRTNIVGTNRLGAALYAPVIDDSANLAEFVFLRSDAADFFPEWDAVADELVGTLRRSVAAAPRERSVTALLGRLATRSEEFRVRWGRPAPARARPGTTRIHHPLVGELKLAHEALSPLAAPEFVLFAAMAEDDSPTSDRLQLLGSLAG